MHLEKLGISLAAWAMDKKWRSLAFHASHQYCENVSPAVPFTFG
jgi:hypothetical protein